MNKDVEALVTRVLAEQAAAVPWPRRGLADAARRDARRRRNVEVGLAAAAVVVGLVLASVLALPGAGRPASLVPAGSGASLAVPEGATTLVAPARLAQGPDPAVSWLSGRVLHRSDGRSLGLPDDGMRAVPLPEGGAVVGRESSGQLEVVDSEGHAQPARSLTWPVAGVHGQVGYVDRDTARFVTVPATGAATEVELTDDLRNGRPVGWLGDDSLVVDLPGRDARVLHADGTVDKLEGLREVTATDGASTVAARSRDQGCLEVRRDGQRLWRSCRNTTTFTSIVAFSPDSHRALLRRSTVPGGGEYAVVVAETGEVLRLFTAAGAGTQARVGVGQAVFEDDDHVLLAVFVGSDESVVRCTLEGACEVAVRTGDFPDGEQGPEPFGPAWVP